MSVQSDPGDSALKTPPTAKKPVVEDNAVFKHFFDQLQAVWFPMMISIFACTKV